MTNKSPFVVLSYIIIDCPLDVKVTLIISIEHKLCKSKHKTKLLYCVMLE